MNPPSLQNVDDSKVTIQSCPNCHNRIHKHEEYRAWCQQCNWNLQVPSEEIKPKTVLEKFQLELSQKHSQDLFSEVHNLPLEALKPAVTSVKVLAFAVATGVYALAALLLLTGLVLIINFYTNLFALVVGLMCLGLAFLARPHLGKLPGEVANREEFPLLYQLTDTISESLGARKVDVIVLTHDYNASFSEVGFRRKRVLSLGVPFIYALEPDEFLALLGHELAHGINGDPQRQRYVGTAIQTLMRWYAVIHPRVLFDPQSGIMDIVALPFNLGRLLLTYLAQGTAFLLINLLWRESQRAEYLADFLSSTISGTKGALRALEKMQRSSAYQTTVHQTALGKADADFFAEFTKRLATFPEQEQERLKRLERLPSSRFDTTHPPVVYRVDFLQAHAVEVGKVSLSSGEFASIKNELSKTHKMIQKQMISAYKSRLYA